VSEAKQSPGVFLRMSLIQEHVILFLWAMSSRNLFHAPHNRQLGLLCDAWNKWCFTAAAQRDLSFFCL